MGKRGIVGRVLGGVLLALLLTATGASAAQQSAVEQDFSGVKVSTLCSWPTGLRGGYLPVHIRVTNTRDQPVTVGLELQHGNPSWNDSSSTKGSLRLEAGQSRELDWLVLYNAESWAENFRLEVSTDGNSRGRYSIHSLDSASANKDQMPLLVVSEDHPSISTKLNGKSAGAQKSWVTGGCEPQQLPTDWRAYTSLGAVLIDPSKASPEASAMAAVLDWVSLGGILVVTGDRATAERLLAAHTDLFRPTNHIKELPSGDLWRHRLGRVVVAQEGGTPLGAGQLDFGEGGIAALGGLGTGMAPDGSFPDSLAAIPVGIPGVEDLPLTGLTVVLILFVLLIGPVQSRLSSRKTKNPYRLLVLTPLLGIGFTFAILGYSLFSQGLDTKQAVISVTWLDQQDRSASTLASRQVLSGSVLRPDLRYSASVAVRPLPLKNPRDRNFILAMDDHGAYQGDFLPVRTPSRELVAAVTTVRAKVAIELEGGQLYAVNGFDFDLPDFFFRDADGDIWTPEDSFLASGARTSLHKVDVLPNLGLRGVGDDSVARVTGVKILNDPSLLPALPHLPALQPRHSYVARPVRSPFVPDGGVARTQVLGQHLLIGVVESSR